MAKSARKGKQKTVSYAEVDSDVDMQWEDRQVQARKTATASRTAKPKKGRGKKRGPLQVFLKAPFDIFAEICSHIKPIDMVNLSRANKMFHNLLTLSAARPLWSRFRSAVKAPAVEYLSDAAYARLVFTDRCSGCDKDQPTKLLWGVLARLCLTCRKKLLIAQRNVRSSMPHLHPETINVAFFTMNRPAQSRKNWATSGIVYHLRSDLDDLSHKLYELQDEDELREYTRPAKRSRGTRTRPVQLEAEEELTAVARYVKERQVLIKKPHEDVKTIKVALDVAEKQQQAEWRENRSRLQRRYDEKEAEFDRHTDPMAAAGWTEEEILQLRSAYVWTNTRLPSDAFDDSTAWTKLHEKITKQIAERRSIPSFSTRRDARKNLKHFHTTLVNAQSDGPDRLTFPSLSEFLNLPHVKEQWAKGDEVDQEKWKEHLEDILDDIEEHRVRTRADTARLILSATNDVPLKTLSDRVDSYDNIDESFFKLATSQLYYAKYTYHGHGRTRWGWYGYGRPGSWKLHNQSYPEAVGPLDGKDDRNWHVATTSPRHVLIVRTFLEAAGLDEETATAQDLDKIGARFRWLEHRSRGSSRRAWKWLPLLHTILKHMPTRQRPYIAPTIVVDEMEDQEAYSDEDELDGGDSAEL